MSNKNADYYFLQGGGEMGELIRAKDWSKTPLGNPSTWPQSLCTMVAVMLDNPFGMYIAWGQDYTQLYNDGYRPILGATKHPQALGISTQETFSEIWHIIDSMFDGVMKGKAVGFPDLMLPLNRNGFVEECYFDFSYSPIRKDNGEVGGVLVTVIETTNKKKAEEALKESEQRFRAMADNIPNLGWMANADGWIYWYNKKWYEYTGTTPEQMEGWGWQSVHDPVELPMVLERWEESIATGHPFEMVFPLKGADGIFRHFLTRVQPIKDNEGKITQWFGTNTDITPQKEIEEALKESEQRFRDTVKQAPVGISILRGKEFVVEMANDAYLRLVDRKATEFEGKPLFESLPEVEESVHALLDGVLNTGVPFHGNEVPIPVNRNGKQEVFYFDFLYHPLKEKDGKISGIIVTVTEVTEKVTAGKKIKENEKLLQSIFFNAPAAIAVITGPEHTYVLANKEYQNMVSRTAVQLLGKTSKAIFPELAGTGTFEIFDAIYESGEAFSLAEYPVLLDKKNDGSPEQMYFRFSAVPLQNTEGKFDSIVIVSIDITEQVAARKKIEFSEQRFQAAIEAVQGVLWTNNGQGEMEGEQPGWAALTGQTYEEYRGYGWAKAIHPDDAQPTVDAWNEAVRQRKHFIFEHRVKIKNGQWRHFSIRAIPLVEADGSLRQWVGVHTDITEQRLAEEKLAYRTTLLEAHNEASVDGILLVDAKGKILSFNQRFIEIWNMPPHIVNAKDDEAALSFAMTQLVNPQQFIDKVKYLYEHPTETSLDELEFKDGKIVERNGYPVIGEDGTYYAWSWTFKDITQRKRIEKDLKNTKEQLELTFKNIPAGVYLINEKGEMVYVNDRGAAVYGDFTPGDMLEQKDLSTLLKIADELFERFDENGEYFSPQYSPAYISLTTGKPSQNVLKQINKATREQRWYYVQGAPLFDEKGNVSLVLITSTDITEQKNGEEKIKNSEERFRTLAQALPQLVWVTDAHGNQEFASVRWKEYSGIEPGGEAEWKALVHPDDYDGINAAWMHCLATGNVYQYDVRLKSRDGEYRWHHVNGEPVVNRDNNIIKWVGAFTDIHEQKMKDERKDEFIGIASHELKTPLTTVKGYLQMLELSLDENNQEATLYTKKASQSVERLHKLTSELLDVSKIRLGKLNYTVTTFNFNEMVDSTVENIQLTMQTHTIIKTRDVSDEVTGDKDRLQQVLINLLTNAIKYSPNSQNVFINVEKQNDMIQVSVRDNGIGIAKESLDKIFEKYHRVAEHAAHFQGLGIGLFISYEIVQRHHGKLWAESEPGKGSTFYFTIPVSGNGTL